jgi:HAT1-interacting factor 1
VTPPSVPLLPLLPLILDPKQVLATAAESDTKSSAKIVSFSGDAEEDGEDDEEDGAPNEEEDKEDDFQIAWEVLETAKMLYESQLEGKKGKSVVGKGSEQDIAIERKMADVCDLLGEVSIENGKILLFSVFLCV